MKLHILFGQRKETYPGEYMPEALAVMDEYGQSDNPGYLDGEKTKALTSGEFENVVVVTVEVNGAKVMEMLRPAKQVLPAVMIVAYANGGKSNTIEIQDPQGRPE